MLATLVIVIPAVMELPVLTHGNSTPVNVHLAQLVHSVWISVEITTPVRTLLTVEVLLKISTATIVNVMYFRVVNIVMIGSFIPALTTGLDTLSVDPVTVPVNWDSLEIVGL